MPNIAIIRPPHTYRYNDLDVREDAIISYWLGYLDATGCVAPRVYDFHIDRTLSLEKIVEASAATHYVVSCRETGDNVFYALRIASGLLEQTDAQVILYGQTGRLPDNGEFRRLGTAFGDRLRTSIHDERSLARMLGIPDDGPAFDGDLQLRPYLSTQAVQPDHLPRVKASIETTRGCHFPCRFCFINSGVNYPKRWTRRPVSRVLADIRAYYDLGVRHFVFNDSEFFGADQRDYPQISELLENIAASFPAIGFKIYARADTLSNFGDFALLKRAGLVSVFIGVESLLDEDLAVLKKKTTSEILRRTIRHLADSGIYMDLSFILFNRNTTLESLALNLDRIAEIYERNQRFLGMPFFSFSFESSWKAEDARPMSPRTYAALDVAIKAPAARGAVFDPALEPLMEIYRLLAYEWSAKVTELNGLRRHCTQGDQQRIEDWFSVLPYFCLEAMQHFLQQARARELTLDMLNSARDELFDLIGGFYKRLLPPALCAFATYEGHASQLDYRQEVRKLEPAEYWDDVIPPIPADYWTGHTQKYISIHAAR